jgi:hypothetical protein
LAVEVIDRAGELATRDAVPVRVLAVARVFGTGLGFPNPGLYPNRSEWSAQERSVHDAISRLSDRHGVDASGHVVGTRAGARRIVREAADHGCDLIVMGADPRRSWVIASLLWSQEPYRVKQRAKIPVELVIADTPPTDRRCPSDSNPPAIQPLSASTALRATRSTGSQAGANGGA